MATFNKFESFASHYCSGFHDLSASGSLLKYYLANDAPSASGDTVKTDLADITNENGYTGPVDTENTQAYASGIYTVNLSAKTVTASGGAIPTFRYVVLYDDTPSDPVDPLIGWWDRGSTLDLADGDAFGMHPEASLLTFG